MLFSEFKTKDVISIRNCKNLGHVGDIEFDECNGQIEKIIIPPGGRVMNLFTCEPSYTICYRDIKQIGPDIILVDA